MENKSAAMSGKEAIDLSVSVWNRFLCIVELRCGFYDKPNIPIGESSVLWKHGAFFVSGRVVCFYHSFVETEFGYFAGVSDKGFHPCTTDFGRSFKVHRCSLWKDQCIPGWWLLLCSLFLCRMLGTWRVYWTRPRTISSLLYFPYF